MMQKIFRLFILCVVIDDLHTCLVAELTGHISVLSGEGEDNIHHNEGRYERKWFQYCPQHSDSPP